MNKFKHLLIEKFVVFNKVFPIEFHSANYSGFRFETYLAWKFQWDLMVEKKFESCSKIEPYLSLNILKDSNENSYLFFLF